VVPILLDRKSELAELEAAWRKAKDGQPQLAVLWGRRRVGKTFLLSHFIRRRRAVFFGATQQAEVVELRRLHEAVQRDLGDRAAALTGGGFTSWESALRYFVTMAADQPLTVVIDEAPYLFQSTAGFASIVQVVWDHLPAHTHLFLILTGSAIGIVEELISTGALRGRPTLARRLEPLDPLAARAFLPSLTASDYIEAYAACGGYPLHLQAWDPETSVTSNLQRLAYTAGGLLLQDAESILSEELSGTAGHSRILAAVGRGKTRYGEIANEAGQRVEAPLETLVRAGFLRRQLAIGAPKGAHPLYEIGDPYLSFWFACLYPHTAEVEAGQGQAVARRTHQLWQRHLGSVFEELARSHAARLVRSKRLPSDLVIGRWWAVRGTPCEIDVLGLEGGRSVLLGEARWQANPLDLRDLEELKRKMSLAPNPIPAPIFALWSRRGVTPSVRRAGALGFGLREMLRKNG
jgi:uncharacterized protein